MWDFPHERRNLSPYSLPLLWQRASRLPLPEKNALYIAAEAYLKERSDRSSQTKFLATMAHIADVEPPDTRDRMFTPQFN